MNDPKFVRLFTDALRSRAPTCESSSRVSVGAGDQIEVVEKPDHDVSVRDVFRIYTRDRDECGRLIAVPQMSAAWKRWARDMLQRVQGGAKDAATPGCC